MSATTTSNEKLKALKLTIDKIEKDFGKGSVMMMNERSDQNLEVISTGSIGLDTALGVGGVPKGRIVEVYGPESTGKTTIARRAQVHCDCGGARRAFVHSLLAARLAVSRRRALYRILLPRSRPSDTAA